MNGREARESWADADGDSYEAGWQWIARGVVVAWLAWVLVRTIGVAHPRTIFAAINLGIHEGGHLLFSPFGQFLMIAGGTILQLLVPTAVGVVFWRRRDRFATCFAAAWLGINLVEVSVYIGDARAQALPLVTVGGGDAIHDWRFMLSRLGCLSKDTAIAGVVRVAGHLLHAAGVIAGAWLVLGMALSRKSSTARR